MRIAVTGVTGFVGRTVAADLVASGYEVIPVVRAASGANLEIVAGDLADMVVPLTQIDACIHLAGRAHKFADDDSDQLAAYRRTNVEGTRRLLEASLSADCGHFIYVSSVKAAGEFSLPNTPLRSGDIPRPEDAYGVSKLEAENLVREFCTSSGMAWTIVRPPLVYGAGVSANFGRLIRLALSGMPLPLGAVDNRRSIVFVGNLSDAIKRMLTTPAARNRLFFVNDGEDLSIADLIRRIGAARGRRTWLFPVPLAVLSIAAQLFGKRDEARRLLGDLQVDARPIREELSWEAPYSIAEGLAATVAGISKSVEGASNS